VTESIGPEFKPQYHKKKKKKIQRTRPDMAVHCCNPSIVAIEARRS
jgi:hypothetical protein